MDVVHGSSIISAKCADSSCTKRRTYLNKLYQKVCHFKGHIILYYTFGLVAHPAGWKWDWSIIHRKIKLKNIPRENRYAAILQNRGTCMTTHVGSRVKCVQHLLGAKSSSIFEHLKNDEILDDPMFNFKLVYTYINDIGCLFRRSITMVLSNGSKFWCHLGSLIYRSYLIK